MEREKREVYQVLANEADFAVCTFCKYVESSGSCCDGDIGCKHPLLDKSFAFEEESERAMNLGDCWGFRPRHPVSFVADIVGIILAQGWTGGVSWWQNKKGDWRITGIKAEPFMKAYRKG